MYKTYSKSCCQNFSAKLLFFDLRRTFIETSECSLFSVTLSEEKTFVGVVYFISTLVLIIQYQTIPEFLLQIFFVSTKKSLKRSFSAGDTKELTSSSGQEQRFPSTLKVSEYP